MQKLKNLYHLFQALIANIFFGFPSHNLTVIGVTGTDGKTTTSSMIYHMLKTTQHQVALISTVAAFINDQPIDTGFHVTTPSPWKLQKLLKQIKKANIEYVVIEATSHGLDQHRLFGIPFTIGVLTNITHEHLDYHKTMDHYVHSKAKLFKHVKYAILNQDDTHFETIKSLLSPQCTIIPYNRNDVIKPFFKEKYNQYNASAAYEVGKVLKLKNSHIIATLNSFPGVPGRMEHIDNQKGIQVIIDFAHTPNAIKQALISLKKQTTGRLIAVYGAAGLRDFSKRPLMGKIGAKIANFVIFTAEDPRTENLQSILYQLKQGVETNHQHIMTIPDRKEAIKYAINLAKRGDTVAIFGKGHERSMNLDGIHEIPWSDQNIARRALL